MSEYKNDWWLQVDASADLEKVNEYRQTKEMVKSADPLKQIEANWGDDQDDLFSSLHDRIMAGVETTSIQREHRPLWHQLRKHSRLVSAFAALIAVMLMGTRTEPTLVQMDSTDLVINDVVRQSADIEQTIVVYQGKDDFFVDVARESLNHLSVEEMQGLVQAARD